jgi:hypothetical protein
MKQEAEVSERTDEAAANEDVEIRDSVERLGVTKPSDLPKEPAESEETSGDVSSEDLF